ncbi:MAG: hypothetical protein H8E00_01030 [Deltaproteobacteria bacterium]|nr:hypothetical protein [Deltaproteobacteria bacterium]
MKKAMLHIISGCLGMVLFVGCSSPDEKANKLFVEASQLIKSAQEVEKTSYPSALKIYNEALTKVDKIISKYPSSQIAVKLSQGEAKIGNDTINEFRETVRYYTRLKTEAEENPFSCAILIFDVAKTIKDANLKVWALAHISEKYAQSGQKDKAMELLSKALAVAKTIKVAHLKALALADISDKYVEVGQKDKAMELVSQAFVLISKTDKDSIELLVIAMRIGMVLPHINKRYSEDERYDKILQEVQKKMQKYWAKAYELADTSDKYAQVGQKDKALELLSRALAVATKIEEGYPKANALAHIANKYAEYGQYDKALKVVTIIQEDYPKANALAHIAINYAEYGQYEKAFQVVNKIVDKPSKAEALTDIAENYFQFGQKDRAVQLYFQSFLVAETIKGAGGACRNTALAHIAKKYAEDGQYDKALNVVTKIENIDQKAMSIAYILAAVAGVYEKGSQKLDDKARMVLHEIIRQFW